MDISTDPIIVFYENMLKRTQGDLELPEYSEIYLRLAFKVVLGKNNTNSPDTLKLYRKLLALHYCAKYASIADVTSIMERVFAKNEIYNIIADENELQEQWDTFRKQGLSSMELDQLKEKSTEPYEKCKAKRKRSNHVDLYRVPLKKQVNVIWLSKVIKDIAVLKEKSGMSTSYIAYILEHEQEICKRWLQASDSCKTENKHLSEEESYECAIVDRILCEWTQRKLYNSKGTLHPFEIEQQANVIKQQLGVERYTICMDFWNRNYSYELNFGHKKGQCFSLHTEDILDDIIRELRHRTYQKFKNRLSESSKVELIADVIECIDISDDEVVSGDNGLDKSLDETKATNDDLPEEKYEENSEKLSEEYSLRDTKKDEDFVPYKDENSIIGGEAVEEEIIRPEVIELLQELEEDIGNDASAHPGSSNVSDKRQDENDSSLLNKTAYATQKEISLELRSTDTIEELVQKYEQCKSQKKQINIVGINSRYRENSYGKLRHMKRAPRLCKTINIVDSDEELQEHFEAKSNRRQTDSSREVDALPNYENSEKPHTSDKDVENKHAVVGLDDFMSEVEQKILQNEEASQNCGDLNEDVIQSQDISSDNDDVDEVLEIVHKETIKSRKSSKQFDSPNEVPQKKRNDVSKYVAQNDKNISGDDNVIDGKKEYEQTDDKVPITLLQIVSDEEAESEDDEQQLIPQLTSEMETSLFENLSHSTIAVEEIILQNEKASKNSRDLKEDIILSQDITSDNDDYDIESIKSPKQFKTSKEIPHKKRKLITSNGKHLFAKRYANSKHVAENDQNISDVDNVIDVKIGYVETDDKVTIALQQIVSDEEADVEDDNQLLIPQFIPDMETCSFENPRYSTAAIEQNGNVSQDCGESNEDASPPLNIERGNEDVDKVLEIVDHENIANKSQQTVAVSKNVHKDIIKTRKSPEQFETTNKIQHKTRKLNTKMQKHLPTKSVHEIKDKNVGKEYERKDEQEPIVLLEIVSDGEAESEDDDQLLIPKFISKMETCLFENLSHSTSTPKNCQRNLREALINSLTSPCESLCPQDCTKEKSSNSAKVELKTDVEASDYLKKLRDFLKKQNDHEAFKIVENLQLAFLLPEVG